MGRHSIEDRVETDETESDDPYGVDADSGAVADDTPPKHSARPDSSL